MSEKSKQRNKKQSVAELERIGVRESYLGRMAHSELTGGIVRDHWHTGEVFRSRDAVSSYQVQADGSLRLVEKRN